MYSVLETGSFNHSTGHIASLTSGSIPILLAVEVKIKKEATPWITGPKYLIRDHDSMYGKLFSNVVVDIGIKELKTPYQVPKANAACERFMGSLKRECLDQMTILSRRQCRQIGNEYVSCYNHARPHQGINQRVPGRDDQEKILNYSGRVKAKPVLNGLHYDYSLTSQFH